MRADAQTHPALRADARSARCRFLDVFRLEALASAGGVLGEPAQLELAAPGTAPGAVDRPLGYEEVQSRRSRRFCALMAEQIAASRERTAAVQARAHAAGAAALGTEELLQHQQSHGAAQQQGPAPPVDMAQLANTWVNYTQASQAELSASLLAMVTAQTAAGRSASETASDVFGFMASAVVENACARSLRDYDIIHGRLCALETCSARTEPPAPRFLSCAACRIPAYCCKEHQAEDWPAHKAACKAARKKKAAEQQSR